MRSRVELLPQCCRCSFVYFPFKCLIGIWLDLYFPIIRKWRLTSKYLPVFVSLIEGVNSAPPHGSANFQPGKGLLAEGKINMATFVQWRPRTSTLSMRGILIQRGKIQFNLQGWLVTQFVAHSCYFINFCHFIWPFYSLFSHQVGCEMHISGIWTKILNYSNLSKIYREQWGVNILFVPPLKWVKAHLCSDGTKPWTYSHNMCRQWALTHAHAPTKHTTFVSVCLNDRTVSALVGVPTLIYLCANMNISESGGHVERNGFSVANVLSYWVTAWSRITPSSEGGRTSLRLREKLSHKQTTLETLLDNSPWRVSS